MRTRTLRWIQLGAALALSALLPCPPASEAAAPEPLRFVDGDVSKLSARVKRVRPGLAAPGIATTWIDVVVNNRSPLNAEPLAFEVTLKDPPAWAKPVVLLRAPTLRSYGRAGKPTRARGKRTYTLQYPGDLSKRTQVLVTVTRASFFEDSVKETAPVKVSRLRADKRGPVAARRSQVTLTNRTALPVDAIFQVTFAEPLEGTVLLGAHLEADEERVWAIDGLTTAGPFGGGGKMDGATVTKVKLVDFTSVHSVGAKRARTLLAAAMEQWQGWPLPWPAVTGQVAFRHAVDGVQLAGAGRYEITAAGAVRVAARASVGQAAQTALEGAVARAFASTHHQSLAQMLGDGGSVRMVHAGARTTVEVTGPGLLAPWSRDPVARVFVLEAGRIVESRLAVENPDRAAWTTVKVDAGYVVIGRHVQSPVGIEQWLVRRTHGSFRTHAGRRVPATWRDEGGRLVADRGVFELVFSDVAFAGATQAPALPTEPPPAKGAGVQAVRAAWDAVYRYPQGALTFEASFRLKHRGTDDVWSGVARVAGQVTVRGFNGRTWKHADVVFQGKVPESKRPGIESALLGRLGMFPGLDFGSRQAFDVAFRGAHILPVEGQASVYRVTAGPVRGLRIVDGRIASVELLDGRVRTYTFKRIGSGWRPTETRTGREIFRVQYEDLGDGWIVPVRVEIHERFGADWGPETLTLKAVKRLGG